MTKRPWTEHVTWDKCPCGCDLYQLGNQRFGVFSEPDARLFASAGGMYEALEALLHDPYSMIRDSLRKKAEEAMLAANPDAFAESEGE